MGDFHAAQHMGVQRFDNFFLFHAGSQGYGEPFRFAFYACCQRHAEREQGHGVKALGKRQGQFRPPHCPIEKSLYFQLA